MKYRVFALAVLIFFTTGFLAQARWKPEYAGSPYADWFEKQENALGQSCCNQADGHFYEGEYSLNPNGTIILAGKEIVPRSKVLTNPNPTGRPIWWYTGDPKGFHTTYCFAPGALT